jgi:hypothetical protein
VEVRAGDGIPRESRVCRSDGSPVRLR